MTKKITARKVTGFLLLLLLAAVFIFSALTKFVSVEPFEWTFMDMGLPGPLSFFLARFFIGLEFAMAGLMLAHVRLRRLTYPFTQVFLAAMTIYLIIILATKGNNVDCGCFGDALPMSPAASILKNVVLFAWVYLLRRIYTPKSYRFDWILGLVLSAASFTLPFLLVPYEQKATRIDFAPLYKNPATAPNVKLDEGKHLVAFMSLGCPHCRHAAQIFADMYKQDQSLPIMMILYGYPNDSTDFFNETKSSAVPHVIMEDKKSFHSMSGQSYVPVIYWTENGVRTRKITYVQLTPELIKNWK